MRKKMSPITESPAALLRRLPDEPDGKKRHRVYALSLVASGQAHHRKAVAAALGVHAYGPCGGWITTPVTSLG